MSPLATTLWIGNLFCDTAGQLFFKAAARGAADLSGLAQWKRLLSTGTLWAGIASFTAEFLLWSAFLSLVPLSQGVLLSCVDIAAVMVGGKMLFGEPITPRRTAAILLISLGVAFVGWA
jgi:drug/metabolite transporter (DMT)-like permease